MTESEQPVTWTVGALVKWATDDFRQRGIESPRLDAEVLLAHALGTTRVQLIIDANKPLVGAELGRFRELVKRRRKREPVAYLLGTREFYGRPFAVDHRVLVPRPDTEVLVQVALERTSHCSLSMRALDLCTGSGCVAITMARERPTSFVIGSDISDAALQVARFNQIRLGAYNMGFVRGDLFEGVRGRPWKFDVITANPPYIPAGEIPTLPPDVRDFEPRLALDGGADGLDFYRRIVASSTEFLDEAGVLAFEVGAGEAPDVARLLTERGFVDVEICRDYGHIERVVSGRWQTVVESSNVERSRESS